MTAKRVYFFQGSQYQRFDSGLNMVPPVIYPRPITGNWSGLFTSGISAAFYRGFGRAYFFSGSEYSRYEVLPDAVAASHPKPIAGNWPGMDSAGFDSGLDAAVAWGNEKVYFFKGNQYVRYDLTPTIDKVDAGYPKPIAGNWGGLAGTGFENGIDAAINYGNGKVYFFRGDSYARIDMTSKSMDASYPKKIAGNWPGVFTNGIDAALEWPFAEVAAGGFNVPTGRSGCIVAPVGGGRNKGGERFRMEIDFVNTPHPTTCAVGEYRQSARGTLILNGATIAFPMANPSGGPPRTLQPRPAVGAASDNFQEDGIPTPPAGVTMFYGHRLDPAGNADPNDQFLPDRATGCQFRGSDFPGLGGVPGTTYSIDVDFRGEAVDSATGGVVLATNTWTVNCAGTL